MTLINPNQKEINEAIGQIVISMDRIAAERQHISDIVKTVVEKFDCKPKIIRQTARAIHLGKTGDVKQDSEELTDMIERVVGIGDE